MHKDKGTTRVGEEEVLGDTAGCTRQAVEECPVDETTVYG